MEGLFCARVSEVVDEGAASLAEGLGYRRWRIAQIISWLGCEPISGVGLIRVSHQRANRLVWLLHQNAKLKRQLGSRVDIRQHRPWLGEDRRGCARPSHR